MAETKPRIDLKVALKEEAALAEEKWKGKDKLEWLQNLKSQMQLRTKRANLIQKTQNQLRKESEEKVKSQKRSKKEVSKEESN